MRRKQKGVALIIALLVITVGLAFLTSASQRMDQTLRATATTDDDSQATVAAEAGIQLGLSGFTNFNPNNLQPTTDDWGLLGDNGNLNYKMGLSSVRIQIADAGSKVNINTATLPQFENMGLTDEQIDCLTDWRSAGQTPQPDGAKDETYNSLPNAYNTKTQNFDTPDELLLVKDFDAKTLFSPPTNTTQSPLMNADGTQAFFMQMVTTDSQCGNNNSTGAPRTNINTAALAQLIQNGIALQVANLIIANRTRTPYTTMASVINLPGMSTATAGTVLESCTVTTDVALTGKINLNTAGPAVLGTIPNLSQTAAQTITNRGGTYTSMTDVASSGLTLTDLAAIADVATLGSQTMIIRSLGTHGGRSVALEAAIDMTTTPPKIRRIQRVLYPDPIAYWGWTADTDNETTLMEPPKF